MSGPIEAPFGLTGLGWALVLGIWLPLCAWLLVVLGRRLGARPGKWAVLTLAALLLAAIPLGDDAYIQWHFNRLCRDAGLHYDGKIEVDGFYDATMRSGYELVEKRGFRFMEHPSEMPGKIERVEMVDGTWRRTVLDRPMARYHYKVTRRHERIGLQQRVYEEEVLDSQTARVVGRQTIYTRYPGWVDSQWLRFFDQRGVQCPDGGDRNRRGDLPNVVFGAKSKR